MRWRLGVGLAAAGVAILVGSGAGKLVREEYRRLARHRHTARGEAELRILNPAGAAPAHAAGTSSPF